MERTIKRAAIITSGGDAPGMNACIRALTLTCLHYNIEVLGFKHGYNGLLNNDKKVLTEGAVRHIIHMGGTILKSARCKTFHLDETAQKAAAVLDENNVDVLFVIGGDGSFRGANHLSNHWSGQVIGLPGTIDNDIDGTDYTIGFPTAVDTAIDAIDKVRDTADAFDRIFLVEVMGRRSGYLALNAGMGSGAEQVITPEQYKTPEKALKAIKQNIEAAREIRDSTSNIIVVAENFFPQGIHELAETIEKDCGVHCRPFVLGYIQRGGAPVSHDRVLATKLGVAAVDYAKQGASKVMIGEVDNHIKTYPLHLTGDGTKTVDKEMLRIQSHILDDRRNTAEARANPKSFLDD